MLGSVAAIVAISSNAIARQETRVGGYQDLVALFTEWRAFQKPKLQEGVPDYSATAMAAQHRGLAGLERRLGALDTASWTRAQRVDWHIVRAEMNGLDFDHRVLKPWATNPAFYVTLFPNRSDQPAREGPHAYGSLELWSYTFPLSQRHAAEVTARLRTIPQLLRQARTNLVGNAKDLWTMGIRSMREQSSALEALVGRLG
ncbi:MAG: hypothetical protein ACREF4_04265, partial [Gammaproteobacteria bacterium]